MLDHALRLVRLAAVLVILGSLTNQPVATQLAAEEETGSKCVAGGNNWCMEGSGGSLKKTHYYYCTTANACQTCDETNETCWSHTGHSQP